MNKHKKLIVLEIWGGGRGFLLISNVLKPFLFSWYYGLDAPSIFLFMFYNVLNYKARQYDYINRYKRTWKKLLVSSLKAVSHSKMAYG